MTWEPGFSLSLTEYDAIRRHLGLGDEPCPLLVPSRRPGSPDQLQVQGEIRAGLTERGLLCGGVLDAELEELCHLVDSRVVTVRAVTGAERAIAAHDGFSGVLASRAADRVTLRPIRAADLVRAVAEILPPALAGCTGIAADRSDQLAMLLDASVRSGSFRVTVGGCDVAPDLVWFDLIEGRYLADCAQDRLVLTPADAIIVSARLHALIGDARVAGTAGPDLLPSGRTAVRG